MIPGPPAVVSSRVVVSVPPPPSRRSHRGALVAAILLAPVLAFSGLELGAMSALSHAQGLAHDLRDRGQFDQAVAVDRAIASRGGDLVFLAHGVIDKAPDDAGRVVLAWASDLDHHGHADQALALLENARSLGGIALPEPDADREHAQIALRSARSEASAGHWAVALHRLDQLRDGNPPKDVATQGEALRPGYALQAARVLLDRKQGAAAVAALDDVVSLTRNGPEAPQAQALLPRALLLAGQQALDAHDQAQALKYLQRLVNDFGSSSQARTARVVLRAPQSVTGTVVRGNSPVAGLQIRLGSHFRQIGNAYQTSSPYFYATTDSRGDFTIADVPVGGPYVVELLESGSWTTTVGPDGPAYQFSVQPLTPVDLAFVVLPS